LHDDRKKEPEKERVSQLGVGGTVESHTGLHHRDAGKRKHKSTAAIRGLKEDLSPGRGKKRSRREFIWRNETGGLDAAEGISATDYFEVRGNTIAHSTGTSRC